MKPVIGVTPLWDEKKDSIWMLPGYMDGIGNAGGTSLMFPFTEDEEEVEQLVKSMDGILLTGGQDVSPQLYNETPLEEGVVTCEKRDKLESLVLKAALKEKKPILGICRGLQFINVHFGGTLHQDLPTGFPSDVNHRQPEPYNQPIHQVFLKHNTPLYKFLEIDAIMVNSCHHQGIKDLAEPLADMAIAPDGLIEAIFHPDYPFLWAVQWHPEFMFKDDNPSRKIFKAFVKACRRD